MFALCIHIRWEISVLKWLYRYDDRFEIKIKKGERKRITFVLLHFFVINKCSLIEIKTQCKRDLFRQFKCHFISADCSRIKYTRIILKLFKTDAFAISFRLQLNTEWAQVEVINLINDGSGLGFGIIGGRSTGVVVKTILPGGVADRVSK